MLLRPKSYSPSPQPKIAGTDCKCENTDIRASHSPSPQSKLSGTKFKLENADIRASHSPSPQSKLSGTKCKLENADIRASHSPSPQSKLSGTKFKLEILPSELHIHHHLNQSFLVRNLSSKYYHQSFTFTITSIKAFWYEM
jgi:hypothetical protein